MKMIPTPLWLLVLLALAIITLILLLWSVKRRGRPHLKLETEGGIDGLIPTIAGLTQGTIATGNHVELLQNGAMWDRAIEDLRKAKKTINLEAFLAKEGELTRRLTDALCEIAGKGVHVRMMLDGSGGKNYGKDDLERLRACEISVHFYHPLTRISNLGRINNRDHRKIIVIDGRIGYVGGHCITDNWTGNAQDKEHFRDISARVEGPVVSQLQSAFAENWIEETGEVPGGEDYFPEVKPAGEMKAHVTWISPAGSPSAVKLLHYMAIRAAQERITIQNPYFLPDPDARKALVDAVKRGVRVRVMIPATEASDSPLVQHASHHHYGTLLKGGIELYDYQQTLLHQKVIVVDGCWAAIGSTNFDDRSFEVNDEVSLAVYDESIAEELERTFEEDLQKAVGIDLETWKRRPVAHKLRDLFAFLFNEQL